MAYHQYPPQMYPQQNPHMHPHMQQQAIMPPPPPQQQMMQHPGYAPQQQMTPYGQPGMQHPGMMHPGMMHPGMMMPQPMGPQMWCCSEKENEWVTLPAPYDAQVLGWVRGKGYDGNLYLAQIANINAEKGTMLVKLNDKLAQIVTGCWFQHSAPPSRKVQKWVEEQNKNDLIVVLYGERCKLKAECDQHKAECDSKDATIDQLRAKMLECGIEDSEDEDLTLQDETDTNDLIKELEAVVDQVQGRY